MSTEEDVYRRLCETMRKAHGRGIGVTTDTFVIVRGLGHSDVVSCCTLGSALLEENGYRGAPFTLEQAGELLGISTDDAESIAYGFDGWDPELTGTGIGPSWYNVGKRLREFADELQANNPPT